jgi:tRNA-specific 2-thiouridylase
MTPFQKTVAVAMSGGVDSSVAAHLLLESGYHVIGVTMLHLAPGPARDQIRKDARAVCDQLRITYHEIDVREAFESMIIEYFIKDYRQGRTPNPCVLCNAVIKWGALYEYASTLGADYFATGHYARVITNPLTQRHELHKAVDTEKDQSYALWQLSQRQLSRTLLPLGTMTKKEIRNKAARLDLHTAHKSDSQEICFVPDDDYKAFLRETLLEQDIKIVPGPIVTANGERLGTHQGCPFYTIGQRKGLGIAVGYPLYVTRIDAENNRLTVGTRTDLLATGLEADHVNWVSIDTGHTGQTVQVKIRYNNIPVEATIDRVEQDRLELSFLEPKISVTRGQSVVLYQDEKVLGGGIIISARSLDPGR